MKLVLQKALFDVKRSRRSESYEDLPELPLAVSPKFLNFDFSKVKELA